MRLGWRDGGGGESEGAATTLIDEEMVRLKFHGLVSDNGMLSLGTIIAARGKSLIGDTIDTRGW